MKIFTDFQKKRYNRSMAILNNLDNEYPLFESESSSGGIQEICRNGCNCTSEHITIYPQDILHFSM